MSQELRIVASNQDRFSTMRKLQSIVEDLAREQHEDEEYEAAVEAANLVERLRGLRTKSIHVR